MSKFSLIAAAFFVIPAPTLAQIVIEEPPSRAVQSKASDLKSDWDKVECRSEDVLGSRLERHQVCLTKWQWWSYEQEAKARVQQWQIIGFTSH